MTASGGLEHDILQALSETGEEDLVALLNSVVRVTGAAEEIASLRSALTLLIVQDTVRLARPRKTGQAKLAPLSSQESIALLAHVKSLIAWSTPDRLWRWNEHVPSKLEVMLTDEGMDAAAQAVAGENA